MDWNMDHAHMKKFIDLGIYIQEQRTKKVADEEPSPEEDTSEKKNVEIQKSDQKKKKKK